MFVLFNLAIGAFLLGGGAIFILECLSEKKEVSAAESASTATDRPISFDFSILMEDERNKNLPSEVAH